MHTPTMIKITEAETAPPKIHPRNFKTLANVFMVRVRPNIVIKPQCVHDPVHD